MLNVWQLKVILNPDFTSSQLIIVVSVLVFVFLSLNSQLHKCRCVSWDFFLHYCDPNSLLVLCLKTFETCQKMYTQACLQCDKTAAANSCHISVVRLRGKGFVRLKPPRLCGSFTVQPFIMLRTLFTTDSSPTYQSFPLSLKRLPNATSRWSPFICTWQYLSHSLPLSISQQGSTSPANIF